MLRDIRVLYAAAAVLCALLAPFGWWLLTQMGFGSDPQHFYAYLTIPTVLLCGGLGFCYGGVSKRMRKLAERDDLTGLFNQNAFLSTASFLLQLAMRHKEPIAFIMMDIDHFKDVNDNHNHLLGTHVIKELSRIITDSTRKSDLTARFGGDEYVLCLPRTGPEDARVVAERIRASVEKRTFTLRSHSVNVTVSIGISSSAALPGLELSRLLEIADNALYSAKDKGRNCVVCLEFDKLPSAHSRT